MTPSTRSRIYLVVDPADSRVKESIIIDGAGNSNHFRFYEPNFEASVKASWFEFSEKTVKTYRVIDGDAVAKDDAPTPPTK